MSTHIIRYQAKPDQAGENAQLAAAVFDQLKAEQSEGLHYATLAAFQEFQKDAADRTVDGTQRGIATTVGSYGFFED